MRTRILGSAAALFGLAMAACEGTGTVLTTPGPPAPPVIVAISPSTVHTASPPMGFVTSMVFDLTVTASQPVDLHQVGIHMIDGTNLGGPMITVPLADLSQQFGTASLPVGTTRRFTLQTPPVVLTGAPHSVAADVVFTDAFGVMHTVTVNTHWP